MTDRTRKPCSVCQKSPCVDEPCCPACKHHNALLWQHVRRDDGSFEGIRVCRDCGYEQELEPKPKPRRRSRADRHATSLAERELAQITGIDRDLKRYCYKCGTDLDADRLDDPCPSDGCAHRS